MRRSNYLSIALLSVCSLLIAGSGVYYMTSSDVYLGELKARQIYKDYRQFELALSFYKREYGQFPSNSIGLAALLPDSSSSSALARRGFIRVIDEDPWGRPYEYRRLSDEKKDGYEIITYGSDGEQGGLGLSTDCRNTDSSEDKCMSEHERSKSRSDSLVSIWSYFSFLAIVSLPGAPLYIIGVVTRWRRNQNLFVGFHLFAFLYVTFLFLGILAMSRW